MKTLGRLIEFVVCCIFIYYAALFLFVLYYS